MNKTRILSTFIFTLILTPMAALADCPLGEHESTLTVGRIMRNFGRFTMVADSIAADGVDPWGHKPVTAAQMTEAIDKLSQSIDCADAVLKNPTGDLLPGKLTFITDEKERAAFVDDYVYFMTDFKDGLIEYREIFKKLQAQKPEDQKFDEANSKREELDNLVNRAHKKL